MPRLGFERMETMRDLTVVTLEELGALAKAGDSAAQKELELRIDSFRKAAESGDARCQVILAMAYDMEWLPGDCTEAFKWWLKAADQCINGALIVVSDRYLDGKAVPRDCVEAFKWISLAAESGIAAVCEKRDLLRKQMTTDQIAEASGRVRFFKTRLRTKAGDAAALRDLGLHYCFGNGVGQDYVEGAKLLAKAAILNDQRAQCNLGMLYEKGLGVAKNYTEAVKWYRQASVQGYATAQMNLGRMYHDGLGVQKNSIEAANMYRKAAVQGNAYAQFCLGIMYRVGDGVLKDFVEGAKWIRKAAELGYTHAYVTLGGIYSLGEGVPENLDEAKKWFQKAAEQEHP